MSAPFTAQRFEWLKQLAADGGLPASALRVAMLLADFFNASTWHSLSVD